MVCYSNLLISDQSADLLQGAGTGGRLLLVWAGLSWGELFAVVSVIAVIGVVWDGRETKTTIP